jgi:hypothetical protein
MEKLIYIITLLMFLSLASPVLAETPMVSQSAELDTNLPVNTNFDERAFVLKAYLESHNSPLSNYSNEFIRYADEYELDWRLVAAITGVESTFGKRILSRSHNAYGWANGNYSFKTWESSIEIVNKTLKERYVDRGANTIDKIAKIYAPPSDSWAWKVKYFMNQIEPLPVQFDL